MTQNLNPEIIYNEYVQGILDKESAINILISLVENNTDITVRLKCIDYLGFIYKNEDTIFKFLENLLTTEVSDNIKTAALRIIFQSFLEENKNLLKWSIKNNCSPEYLADILNIFKDNDEIACRRILINGFKSLISNKVQIKKKDNDYLKYYVENLENLFKKKLFESFTFEELREIFINFSFIIYNDEIYGLSYKQFEYDLRDGLIRGLEFSNQRIKKITDIEGILNLKRLESLNLSSNQIKKIEYLENFPNLKSLYLGELDGGGNQITEIEGLDSLKKLEYLDLSWNSISEIKNLENLENLIHLSLGGNQIKEIKGLESLTNLEWLCLDRNQITEIKGLEKLTNLVQLFLDVNRISEIKGLKKLTKLVQLFLEGNQISEIKGLDSLTNLEWLTLRRNQIAEIKGLENLTKLEVLDLLD